MTIGIATVITARDWEPALVAYARDSALVRIVVRAYQPQDIDTHRDGIDVVIAGGDVSWVTPALVTEWKSAGLGVVGVVPDGDEPASRLLTVGGADEVVPDSIDSAALVQAARFLAPVARAPEKDHPSGRVTAVVGTRGGPGCTEVALAYAASTSKRSRCVLADFDLHAPAMAIRLGIPARPDIVDAADSVREHGEISSDAIQRIGRLDVIPGSHRPGETVIREAMLEAVVRVARQSWDEVILDLGSFGVESPHLAEADEAILVVDASPVGIVRAAHVVAAWIGPAPALVINRADGSGESEVVDAVKRWTGLEPAIVLSDRRRVRRAASAAQPPERRFARAVGRLGASS